MRRGSNSSAVSAASTVSRASSMGSTTASSFGYFPSIPSIPPSTTNSTLPNTNPLIFTKKSNSYKKNASGPNSRTHSRSSSSCSLSHISMHYRQNTQFPLPASANYVNNDYCHNKPSAINNDNHHSNVNT
eukprot:UN06738